MSQQLMPIESLFTGDQREWYKNDTNLIDKTGIVGTIILIEAAPFQITTILVDKTGLVGTTTDI